jgi:hypothetical protein
LYLRRAASRNGGEAAAQSKAKRKQHVEIRAKTLEIYWKSPQNLRYTLFAKYKKQPARRSSLNYCIFKRMATRLVKP